MLTKRKTIIAVGTLGDRH